MAERDSHHNLPTGWSSVSIKDVIEKVPLTGKKVKQRDYQSSGIMPIIDQGRDYIGGYSDLQDIAVHSDSPVIIFGDHTKAIKYVDFDFIAGADGVKVIKPLEMWYPKFFYYLLQNVKLPDKGYARHFQFLEKINRDFYMYYYTITLMLDNFCLKKYGTKFHRTIHIDFYLLQDVMVAILNL